MLKLATSETSGSTSGLISSFKVAAVGKGFFSSVSTCFNLPTSKDFTSARDSIASSLIVSAVGMTDFSFVSTRFSVFLLKSDTPETSGRVSGLISSFNVAAVGKVFFSSVFTFFKDDWSKTLMPARELCASSSITSLVGITCFSCVSTCFNFEESK